MSGLRMNKVVRFSAAAGFLIAILLLLAISAGKKQVASTSSDHILSNRPPVIVVGGSLYGDAKDKNWAGCQNPDHRTDEYCVSVGNDKYILSSKNYNPRISLACTTDDCKSWKIFIVDKHSNANADGDQGIELCSNASCKPTDSSDAQYVYIRVHDTSKSQWENSPPPDSVTQLFFQDNSDHCGPYDSGHHHGQGNCERPSVARVCIGSSCLPESTCSKDDGVDCAVGVGKPQLSDQP